MTTFWVLLTLVSFPTIYSTVLYMHVMGNHLSIVRALERARAGDLGRPDVSRLCAETERNLDHFDRVGKLVVWGWGLLFVFSLLMEILVLARLIP